jgi:tryptophan synthase beta chain
MSIANPVPSIARSVPDDRGRFGRFGGRYVPETLVPALEELLAAYAAARADPSFQAELDVLLREFVGRSTPMTEAPRLTAHAGGARIVLQLLVDVEQADRQPVAPEQQRAKKSDGSAA